MMTGQMMTGQTDQRLTSNQRLRQALSVNVSDETDQMMRPGGEVIAVRDVHCLGGTEIGDRTDDAEARSAKSADALNEFEEKVCA
jgi:hypothetical protein